MKLQEVKLINYSKTEDTVNAITHLVGFPLGIVALILCLHRSITSGSKTGIIASVIYGISIMILYAGSAMYHGAKPGRLKKILRVIDHCNVFLLIAGSMTPYSLVAFRPDHPVLCWVTFSFAWGSALFGIIMTSINQEKFKTVQMILYIAIGWVLIFAIKPMISIFSGIFKPGLILLFVGGGLYTIGAIFCGIGKKLPYFHAIFHGFVLAGSIVQFVSVYNYVLVM